MTETKWWVIQKTNMKTQSEFTVKMNPAFSTTLMDSSLSVIILISGFKTQLMKNKIEICFNVMCKNYNV